jgi:Zn-dependent M28 family amino/carboxypeptidase
MGLPVLEITPAAALQVTGLDVLAPLAAVDKSGKAPKPVFTGRAVSMASGSEMRETVISNVVGKLAGSDPELAHEYVVIGAHYDHVGVDVRGRVGTGADDNASGTAAMLEVAEAMAAAGPRRSILACAFAAEEDGLIGSDQLAEKPPVPRSDMAAMINLDMVGFGDVGEVAVIGVPENPAFEKLLKAAKKLKNTKVKKIVTGQGQEVFQRSDHYSFHKRGVPALFFFEGLPVGKNPHYHTWHDTLDTIDVEKIARTSRLVFNTMWLLAEDDDRPPAPRHSR